MPTATTNPRSPGATIRRGFQHAGLALASTAAVIGVASSCMFLTTASEAVNLIFEPLSLLLMPGLVAGLVISNLHRHHAQETHDFSTNEVLALAAAFYFCFFFVAFWWWSRRRRAHHT
jgi:di/tricarboxylate transporter